MSCDSRWQAAKAAAEGVAVAVGAAVVFTSLLSKAGYVTINYVKVEHDVMQLMDLNKDGKLDEKEYELVPQPAPLGLYV